MTATLLPNAKQQYFDANGNPLASGTVTFYIPGTSTLKNTYQDAAQTILNTNPVVLDAAGEAIIFGQGAYRQVVKDSLGNTIWDQLTYDTSIPFGTSTTSVTIGTGSQNFITQPGLGFIVGMSVLVTQSGTPANYMTGTVTAYNSGTGSLTVNVIATGGSGTIAGWNIVLSGPPGPTGAAGPTGTFLGPQATLASATTTDLGSTGVYAVGITGTTTITSFGSSASINNPFYFITFTGALLLTYNATSLKLPGIANITTAANDTAIAEYLGSGNWQVWFYQKAATNPIPAPGTSGNILTSNGTGWISSANAPNTYQASPSNPTGTTSATGVMMGLAGTFTPVLSTVLFVTIEGVVRNSTSGTYTLQIRHGTGTAPINGAALTGTAVGTSLPQIISGSVDFTGAFSLTAIITGATLATARWLDISAATNGGTVTPSSISISVFEIK